MDNKNLIMILIAIVIAGCVIDAGIYFTFSQNNEETMADSATYERTNITEDKVNIEEDSADEDNGPVYDISQYKGYEYKHESEMGRDGWNPAEHEQYREYLSNGNYKIHYDDGYFRLCDKNGYILTYGFG